MSTLYDPSCRDDNEGERVWLDEDGWPTIFTDDEIAELRLMALHEALTELGKHQDAHGVAIVGRMIEES